MTNIRADMSNMSDNASLNFGAAIGAMQNDKKVARRGWTDKQMWLVIMPPLYLPPNSSQKPGAKVNDRTARHIGEDTHFHCQPYVSAMTADSKWRPGWVPTQEDMLADDWFEVKRHD